MAIANRRDLSDHRQLRLALHLETLMSCDRQRRRFLKLHPLAEVGLSSLKLSSRLILSGIHFARYGRPRVKQICLGNLSA
jgi:hypothetical protein